MTYIGTFAATRDGFEGRLQTLTLDTRLALIPAEPSETENAPDYRIMVGDDDAVYEVGAGWKRVGESRTFSMGSDLDSVIRGCHPFIRSAASLLPRT